MLLQANLSRKSMDNCLLTQKKAATLGFAFLLALASLLLPEPEKDQTTVKDNTPYSHKCKGGQCRIAVTGDVHVEIR